MARLEWFGHAAWRIELDGKTILIDPFLSQNPLSPIKPERVEKADYVIITHDHADHVEDSIKR